MSGQTILITGATGHVGYATLLEAIRKGYKVRAAVRSEAKADLVRRAASSKSYVDESKLSFTIVPDITKDGAFDEAVKGVVGILHIASPIPGENVSDFEEDLIKPAVHGTTSILYSALKEPAVKKVVITASVASLLGKNQAQKPFTADAPVDKAERPFDGAFNAYRASKAESQEAATKFVEKEKPHFGLTRILPGYVVGANELETTTKGILSGSNGFALQPVLGQSDDSGRWFTVVHLDDVAFLHVAALNPDPKYNGLFGASYNYAAPDEWNDAIKYAKKFFPKDVESGLLPANGNIKSLPQYFDTSKTEEVFGFKFKGYEEQIKNALGHYIEIAKSEQK